MAIPWLTVLQAVPWGDVIRNAPKVADGAKKLLERTRPRRHLALHAVARTVSGCRRFALDPVERG